MAESAQVASLRAVGRIGRGKTDKARLTAAAIIRNREISEELGITTAEDIANMRRGKSHTVLKAPSDRERVSCC